MKCFDEITFNGQLFLMNKTIHITNKISIENLTLTLALFRCLFLYTSLCFTQLQYFQVIFVVTILILPRSETLLAKEKLKNSLELF